MVINFENGSSTAIDFREVAPLNSKENMSQAARDRAVENFDIKGWINKHKVIFKKLLTY